MKFLSFSQSNTIDSVYILLRSCLFWFGFVSMYIFLQSFNFAFTKNGSWGKDPSPNLMTGSSSCITNCCGVLRGE